MTTLKDWLKASLIALAFFAFILALGSLDGWCY